MTDAEPDRPSPLGQRAVSIVAALLTPFDQEGNIDHAALRDHVEILLHEGIDALMPCGTTGEGALLGEQEVAAAISTVVEVTDGRALVFAHVGRPDTPATLRLTRHALGAGASTIVAVVPYYFELGQPELAQHYRAVIGVAGDTPVFAYNIPSRTSNDLSAATAASLAERGLAGIKDSTGSMERHEEYLDIARRGRDDRFRVFIGSDNLALDAFRRGSAGCVSGLANLRPDLLVRLRDAHSTGSEPEASAIQDEIVDAQATQGPSLVALKRATARWLAGMGVSYPDVVRPPLA